MYENGVEQESPEVSAFVEKVKHNIGQLVPINIQLPDGRKMFLQLRQIPIPSDEYPPRYTDLINEDMRGELLVDLFVENPQNESGYESVGHRDWVLYKDGLAGSGNLRDITKWYSKEPRNKEADDKWENLVGTHVITEVQNQGLGSFMLTISLPVLKELGVSNVRAAALISDPIVAIWKKFGADKKHGTYPIDQMLQSPAIGKSIAKFV